MHKIAIIAYFKDEAHLLTEWILHHLSSGIDHIYLIDNGSTDSSAEIAIAHKKHVTLIDGANLRQMQAYNRAYDTAKELFDWVIFLDLDEFLYIKQKDRNIPNYLSKLDNDIQAVRIYWKIFLPTRFFQPKSIIKESILSCRRDKISVYPYKSIFRTTVSSGSLGVHSPEIQEAHMKTLQPDDDLLQINHYRFQSYEYILGIKSERGAGNRKDKYRPTASLNMIQKYFNLPIIRDTYLRMSSREVVTKLKRTAQIKPKVEIYNAECWKLLSERYNPEGLSNDALNKRQSAKRMLNAISSCLTSSSTCKLDS